MLDKLSRSLIRSNTRGFVAAYHRLLLGPLKYAVCLLCRSGFVDLHTVKMKGRTILSQGLLANRAICQSATYVGGYGVQWRRYSTPVTAPGVLPLEGIRVLDMTRVLAGVSTQLNLQLLIQPLTAF